MNARYPIFLFCLLVLLVLLIAACGGGGAERPDEGPPATAAEVLIGDTARETIGASAVMQTRMALNPADTPTAVLVPEESSPDPTGDSAVNATDTPVSTGVAIVQSPTKAAPSCTVVSGVNLRSGPGVAYTPPIGSVSTGTTLRPLAFLSFGYPQGPWLQVEVTGSGQVAWLSAGSQYVSCTVDLATLPPPSAIPATPRPVATDSPPPAATSQTVAAALPNLNVISSGILSSCQNNDTITSTFDRGSRFLLRVFAHMADQSGDGAGIDRVEFSVSGSEGQVYSHTERTAGYCIFQGGEPTCNDWPRDGLGRPIWGNGGRAVVDDRYLIIATVFPKDTSFSECNWQIYMDIDAP